MSAATVAAQQDSKHVPASRASKLRQDAEAAAEVRALSNHPDVVALRVEKVRAQVDALIWLGIALGLGFTMVNVQTFAADRAPIGSLPWVSAWLLDPMVSLTLVAVLRAEQVTARYQVSAGVWADRTKWFAFLATYVMNTWQSWTALHVAGIVLHSVPPVLVFCAAETAPWLRDRLTEAVNRAAATFTDSAAPDADRAVTLAAPTAPTEPAVEVAEAPAPTARRAPARRPKRKAARKPAARKLFADYLADARATWIPGTEITPAWAREVTGCSKGLSSKLAAALRAEVTDRPDPTTEPANDQPADTPVSDLQEAA